MPSPIDSRRPDADYCNLTLTKTADLAAQLSNSEWLISGMIDDNGIYWFGENRGNKIGAFDTKAQKSQEWASPIPEFLPYDVTADKNGEAWAVTEFADRVERLNPKTGVAIDYLLPRKTNARRAWVDNKTNPVTFWVGNNHGASIVKVEPLQ